MGSALVGTIAVPMIITAHHLMPEDLVKQVYRAADLSDAYVARGRLWAAGIHAIIRGRDVSALRELQISQATLPSVWVDDADAEQAQRIVGGPPDGYK